MTTKIERGFVVRDQLGLHARVASRLAQTARRFDAVVEIQKGEHRADAKSIIEVLMLVATKDEKVRIRCQGNDARQALAALGALVENGFHEARPACPRRFPETEDVRSAPAARRISTFPDDAFVLRERC